ncbi:MAG: SgcJ/EcaC family oxidoreductase [Acidobacteria bacterium]|nr:SgcJ/EcaC family oxidoreductase [Acidobacteriota bacterium]
MVLTKRRVQRIVAADILNRCGAEFVGFYGRWAWEDLSATARTSPEDFPAWFARAWNDRDPDALASLFDEDAEFVNVTGVCWHDRESIRKAHADGLERIFNKSTLATDATKVQRLSPDIAVVHARMTLSGQAPVGAVTHPGPRTTIVSFVVHRIGERWLCASVHNTDVIPNMETNVIDEAGVFRSANYQSGQVS